MPERPVLQVSATNAIVRRRTVRTSATLTQSVPMLLLLRSEALISWTI